MNWLKNIGKSNKKAGEYQPLPDGWQAPDFTLPAVDGGRLSLSDLKGQPVVLVFYPEDKSPVCSSQLALYNDALPVFQRYSAQLLGISVDDPQSHREFASQMDLKFPLLSDHDPRGEVASLYGVYNVERRVCARALFVIDAQGVIRWSHVSPPWINPGAGGILEALESFAEKDS